MGIGPTRRAHIVLAEDNPADITLVKVVLRQACLDFDLTVIEDGHKVIDLLEAVDREPERPPIDLLLLDLHLPKRNGEEILIRRRSSVRSCGTPVIVLSGAASPGDAETARQYGVFHFFEKPASLAEFLQLGDIVRDALSTKKSGTAS